MFWTPSEYEVKMPNDIALLGFEDFEMAELISPPFSVVRKPAQEMGRVVANLLLERVASRELPQTGNRIMSPIKIVLRRSCGCKHRAPVVIR
jgi:LacI family transcriptional regulator